MIASRWECRNNRSIAPWAGTLSRRLRAVTMRLYPVILMAECMSRDEQS